MRQNGVRLLSEWLWVARCGLPLPMHRWGFYISIGQKQKNHHTSFERQITHLGHRLVFEPLEQRTLLSVDMQFHHIIFNPLSGSSAVGSNDPGAIVANIAPLGSSSPPSSAFTPLQIQTAYGINLVSGNGAGETIAIVDAYYNPNIVNDLQQFDLQFGLSAPPSFQQLNQNGGTNLSGIPTDSTGGWEMEEALDVEWAHAIAPGANIVLIEANSASTANLLTTAVNTTRNLSGVSVVSMSFGLSEYSGETSLDYLFTTPSGHTGVTFVASTGDSGSPGTYPAYSPNVVAVGGTSLYLSGNNYSSETGWSDSGGGQSRYESKPSYQSSVQSSGYRQIPDIAFDADPNTGVAVYDSYNGGSSTPWFQVGGTSLSAPCWAGLIAIADQLRAGQGLTPLDGATQTLPKLYSLSTADFHDITSGSNGGFSAHSGYDEVTGLGTPTANKLVPDLALPPVPDLTITKTHTGNFHPGDIGNTYTITVTNSGAAATSGTVSVVDTLPSGLTATALSGSGWSINLSTLTATCSDVLAVGASYPALTLAVNVAANAPSNVTNTVTVSGGGETYTANDTASDPTVIGLPIVSGVTPSLDGGSLTAGTTMLAINFNETMVGAGTAANYQLQNLGSDGLLGTADDVIVPLSVSYSGTTATLTFAPLVENIYRLTVHDTITDSGGVKLDGNGDGTPGGNWVSDFDVVPSSSLFGAATSYSSVGSSPLGLTAGDFNSDGKPDLAAANSGNGTVQILLNNGNGTFTAGNSYASGYSDSYTADVPYAVTTGDFNGDGKIDLAVANYDQTHSTGTVQILLGNGNGTFTVGNAYSWTRCSPISIAVADFNSDGKLDLAVTNYNGGTVSILPGNGDGTFPSYTNYNSGGTNPRALTIADFNGDGKPDIAVENYTSGNVGILLNNGNGTFPATATTYSSGGTHPRSIAVGDFNGDSKPDIVVGNHDSNNIGILLNNGTGTFPTTAITYGSGGTNPRGVAVADFNGDGKPDVAVTNSASSTVGILLGNGSGGFASATTYSTGSTYGPFGVAVGDFNVDGLPDLAVTNSGSSASSNSVSTLLDFYGPNPVTMNSPNSYAFNIATDFFGPGEFIQGTNNAFDGFGRLMVGGVLFRPSQQTYTIPNSGADSGQSVITATGTASGLAIYRKITVPNSGGEDFAHSGCLYQPNGQRYHHNRANCGQSRFGHFHGGFRHLHRRRDPYARRPMVRYQRSI